jgi:hypothetical protein
MRLTRQQITGLSAEIAREVTRMGLMELSVSPAEAASSLEKTITEDLMVEDRLNDEVRDILKTYQQEMDQGRMDYNTMFELVKKKLVKERCLIL